MSHQQPRPITEILDAAGRQLEDLESMSADHVTEALWQLLHEKPAGLDNDRLAVIFAAQRCIVRMKEHIDKDDDDFEPIAGISMVGLVAAGTITENDEYLGLVQGIDRGAAHAVAKWLALATGTPAKLRWMTIGAAEDIEYTPQQVYAEIRAKSNRK